MRGFRRGLAGLHGVTQFWLQRVGGGLQGVAGGFGVLVDSLSAILGHGGVPGDDEGCEGTSVCFRVLRGPPC